MMSNNIRDSHKHTKSLSKRLNKANGSTASNKYGVVVVSELQGSLSSSKDWSLRHTHPWLELLLEGERDRGTIGNVLGKVSLQYLEDVSGILIRNNSGKALEETTNARGMVPDRDSSSGGVQDLVCGSLQLGYIHGDDGNGGVQPHFLKGGLSRVASNLPND